MAENMIYYVINQEKDIKEEINGKIGWVNENEIKSYFIKERFKCW